MWAALRAASTGKVAKQSIKTSKTECCKTGKKDKCHEPTIINR